MEPPQAAAEPEGAVPRSEQDQTTDARVDIASHPETSSAVEEIERIDRAPTPPELPVELPPALAAGENDDYYFGPIALGCLTTEHPVRALAITVVSSFWFEVFMLLVVVVSSAFVAAVDPLKGSREGFNAVCYYSDIVFLVIFVGEAILKIIAMGFVRHKGSYLRGTLLCIHFCIASPLVSFYCCC